VSRVQAGEQEGSPAPAKGLPAAARKRAAVETWARNESALRRTARRFSLCEDDADESLQRALEILLRKAPSEDPRELVRWTQTVVRHEALAVRRDRERILSGPAAATPEPDREDWTALIPSDSLGPEERAERSERIARSREALRSLKPQELRALTLLAEGYSYLEIGEITGFSSTKINRCLAEGRERFRRFLAGVEQGERCAEMAPLISAFCDGEAGGRTEAVREHLRACPHCRATLRAYRAAPGAAAALAPTVPLGRSLLDRAHDAFAGVASRFGGGGGEATVTSVATSGGTRSAGLAALAKVAAVCVGTAGGAAACVATGVLPTPAAPVHHEVEAAHVSHHRKPHPKRELLSDDTTPAYETEAAAEPAQPAPDPQPKHHEAKPQPKAEVEVAPVSEPEPEPASASGAVEYEPPPPPPPPAPTSSSVSSASSGSTAGGGDPAGEFGP
jgi:RNA polymerase sigma factor (sigma-70 family)